MMHTMSIVVASVILRRVHHFAIFILLRVISTTTFLFVALADEYAKFFVNWNKNSIILAFSVF